MKYFHRPGHSPPADSRRAIVISQSMCTLVLVYFKSLILSLYRKTGVVIHVHVLG